MLHQTVTIVPLGLLTVLLVLGHVVVCAAESRQAQSQQAEPGKGLTVEDLARGVRSAAQNIEKEIPKIGAAIGKTVQSIRGNSPEKAPSRQPPPDKK
jgi:hypothetical protein